MREQKCGVQVVGIGVDSFYTVEDEEDIAAVVMLIRKAAQLPQNSPNAALQRLPEDK